ncbi:MAG: helix-turn-helix transcriptional regulator, partial [Oscillospiraceae bacterium]|nr:helix-turn-helix transcriptional regulator [Oscillospiraceae bacterium]
TKWKNGSVPTGETLQKLADYFGVSVDYLLNEETKKSPAEAEDKITCDDFTYAMYNHSADLTEEEKKMLLEMAEFMKKKRGL